MLVCILEALHEELNKSISKTYESFPSLGKTENDVELSKRTWNFYLIRDNSIITDLFQGLFKTTISCQECHRQSITFDPFTNISLSIPRLKKVEVVIVPFISIQKSIQLPIFVTEETLFYDLTNLISYYLNKEVKGFRFVLINGYDTGKIIKLSESIMKMSRKGIIICQEIDERIANEDFYTPICYFKTDDSDYFSYPKMFPATNNMKLNDFNIRIYGFLRRYLDFPEGINKLLNNQYEDLVENYTKTNRVTLDEYEKVISYEYSLLFEGDDIKEKSEDRSLINDFVNNLPYEVYLHQISTDKEKSSFKEEKIIIFNGKPNERFSESKKIDELINSIKKGNRLVINFKISNSNGVKQEKYKNINNCLVIKTQVEEKDPSLRDCFQIFSSTEKFDRFNEWYCSKCKKTQQAYKKTEVFYTPKYLIIHLKRFEYVFVNKASGKNSTKTPQINKIETNVIYPVVNFNFSEVTHNLFSTNEMFDLYGVIQHYGSQSGGHYTSLCKNNSVWYDFNDNSVFKIEEEYVKSNSAYLLFYRKKI